jgi:hypothetical protein
MITTCLIIGAWTTGMPTWASITITIIAGVRFFCKCLASAINLTSDKKD